MGAWYFRAQKKLASNDPERLESSPNPKSTHFWGIPPKKRLKLTHPIRILCQLDWIHQAAVVGSVEST